jgi:hypothetical protein
MSLNEVRLIDVFVTGPLQIYVSTFIPDSHLFLKYFMMATGILNILYNGHNYLFFNNTLKDPIFIFKPFISSTGKNQIHRIYNLFIMYPLFFYILLNFNLPKNIYFLFLINIIIGFIFNLYNYLTITS